MQQTPHNKPMVEFARFYAEKRNWRVLPVHGIVNGKCTCGKSDCSSPGKHPACRNGVKDATTDAETIQGWWTENQNYNIAIACGPGSNLFVIDADGPSDIDIPSDTLQAVTSNDKRHFYFAFSDDVKGFNNRVRIPGTELDIRTDGGYVVAPPSIHHSGCRYQWAPPLRDVKPLPPETAAKLRERLSAKSKGCQSIFEKVNDAKPDILTTIPFHQRNDILFRKACSLRRQGCSEREISVLIHQMNKDRCNPVLSTPAELRELDRLISSACTYNPGYLVPDFCINTNNNDIPDKGDIPYDDFPLDIFPHTTADAITSASKAINCHPSYIALPFLACSAAAIGNSCVLQLKTGHLEPAVLWTAIVGLSGSKKTPALHFALEPFIDKQTSFCHENQKARDKYDNDLKLYERDLVEFKRGKKQIVPTKPSDPILKQIYASDTTVEALCGVLNNNPRGLLLYREELAAWVTSFDAYKHGSSDVHTWLEFYSARSVMVNRAGKKPIVCNRAAVSVTGGIQPSTLSRLLTAQAFETGFAGRLLFAFPPTGNFGYSDDVISDADKQALQDAYTGLWALRPDDDEPVVVKLSEAAYAEWKAFTKRQAAKKKAADNDEHVVSALTKIDSAAARIALVLHCLSGGIGDVTAETMINAIKAADWFAAEMLRVYKLARNKLGVFNTHPKKRDWTTIITEYIGNESKSARDLQRSLNLKSDILEPVLSQMVSDNVLTISKKIANNGKDVDMYSVNLG